MELRNDIHRADVPASSGFFLPCLDPNLTFGVEADRIGGTVMNRKILGACGTLAACILIGTAATAQTTETPKAPAPETAPQSSASTTVKAPAGVTSTGAAQNDTTGSIGAKTGCKTASAEMTNGATESCKQ
jgi:hypothetical protein